MRLRRSVIHGPGIARRRCGRGFTYRTSAGAPVSDAETLNRIRALAIPPAWRKVWICPHPNGHIQAVGRDIAGRRQYLYHEQWRRERDEEKFDRVLELAALLPRLRAQLRIDLSQRGLHEHRVLAVAIALLDSGVFRVGGEEYAESHGTHGAATLLRAHARVADDEIRFDYPAKGSIQQQVTVRDRLLAKVIRALLGSPAGSARLLVHRNGRGYREVRADDVNARFRELTGPEFSVKDLRTWQATALAAADFATSPRPASIRGRRAVIKQVMTDVAEVLGNTPAVARASYVDPRVVRAYENGTTIAAALRRAARAHDAEEQRNIVDRAVIRLLRGAHRPDA
ncbi:DNA topoisomerase IB [Nocardia huaxiensis]|uniref:DNA topoisomerase n=1 Tax=Nocardia huaxiensis TaxID=2755382 RepID=A0A7D6ZIB9_9NOCA|nr:DNA topoisomerase IB [Nocardia huaxiensis]QLY34278.1 DNA topoisomerase IB [Nocardia huaxiensis]UFT00097.1 DNA topoisomerase IB [Nocardia huaxiensis]